MPEVSVIIPAYNQGDYLRGAIQSALDQTFADLEVLVIDDGSTDHTPEVIRQFNDPRVCGIRQPNQGLSAARNTGLRQATGRYLTFLDSDDQFLNSKLTLLRSALEADPTAGMAVGQVVLIDELGRTIDKSFESRMPTDSAELLLGNPFHVGSVLLERAWQQKIGFFDETLRSYEDWDFWLRLVQAGCRIIHIDRPVSNYRFHTAQMTRNGAQMTRANFAVLDKVFSGPELPARWHELRDLAYANAHLRAAAHAYLAGDFALGKSHLERTVQLNPQFTQEKCAPLANRLVGMMELPKTSDPLVFLENVFDHLPPQLSELRQRRSQVLGETAINLAFHDLAHGNLSRARTHAWQAVRYQPRYLANKGVLSILVRSYRSP